MLKKIVLIGPESTGKTTLVGQLAQHFNTVYCPEYLRLYLDEKEKYGWQNEGELVAKSDLKPLAIGQMNLENQLAQFANGILFCDTNLLTNQIYAQYYLNDATPWLDKAIEGQNYGFYLLLTPEVAWIADSQRDSPQTQQELYAHFKKAVELQKKPYSIIDGKDYQKRFQKAMKEVEVFLRE